jgi:acetylornithine deacetylase
MSRRPDERSLLSDLVATPSVSGSEGAAARCAAETARGWGLPVEAQPYGVVAELTGPAAGPTLALVSHLDTVPAGEGWTRPPFEASIENGRLYGRGASDAKASAAAMLAAAADVAVKGLPRGRLLVILGFGEETAATTMAQAVAAHAPVDAAIVGEPTGLDLAIAQRGLLMVDLVARGSQRHAAHAGEPGFENAAIVLARDLLRLHGLFDDRAHPVLGRTTATPTSLAAGIGRNVTPPVAKALLDVRSTPDRSHAEIAGRLREALDSEVVIVSDRLVPCETPASSRLLAACRRARPQARRFGSATCSDWVFLREADAVKCGPGDTHLSHTPDEWVALDEVRAARELYTAAVWEYCS